MKPVVDGLQQAYGDRVDFMVYGDLNNDSQGAGFARAQGVTGVPTSMLVAPDGREVRRWVGAASEQELRDAFDEILDAQGP